MSDHDTDDWDDTDDTGIDQKQYSLLNAEPTPFLSSARRSGARVLVVVAAGQLLACQGYRHAPDRWDLGSPDVGVSALDMGPTPADQGPRDIVDQGLPPDLGEPETDGGT